MVASGSRWPHLRTKQIVAILFVVVIVVPVAFVGVEAARTLGALNAIERERDRWQRPEEILRHLNLAPGKTVVDLGSGAGYFALRIAPRVAPDGQVLAVDLRRQSLGFLWIRAVLGGQKNLHVIRGHVDNPMLPPGPVDAVLIANTYHEVTEPAPILKALFGSMRSGARLVVVDRGPREDSATHSVIAGHHHITPTEVETAFNRQGFKTVARDDRFVDRPGDEDLWWLIVFDKP